jgi:hypothetical protein
VSQDVHYLKNYGLDMAENGFRVYVPDPSHGEGDWSNDALVSGPSNDFRIQLEAEYGEKFQFTSIGTGAAIASYFTELATNPYKAAAFAVSALYAGKAVKDVFDGWTWVFNQLSKFFHYDPTFDREGAAIILYKAIVDKMDGVPKNFQLTGFTIQNRLAFPDPTEIPDPGRLTTIEPPPSSRVQRAEVYVFRVVADGCEFRVAVDGHEVTFLQQ